MRNTRIATAIAAVTFALIGAASAQAVPAVDISVSDQAYTLPASVPAGFVQFNLKNTGAAPHNLQVFKLNSGVSKDALLKAVEGFALTGDAGAEALLNAADLYGGVVDVAPGQSGSAVLKLDPGEYVATTLNPGGDDKNPQALAKLGLFQPFTVSGPANTTAPQADYKVALADFAVALPATQISAGKHTFEVANQGRQPHFLMMARVQDGHTQEDVMKFLMAGPDAQGEPPLDMTPGLGSEVMNPGHSNYVTMDLTPGTYFVACFVGDPKTGQPHAMLGMSGFFTVK